MSINSNYEERGKGAVETSLRVTEANNQTSTQRDIQMLEALNLILGELRIQNLLLAEGLRTRDDPAILRNDPSFFN